MNKEYWQNAINAYNKVVDVLQEVQPIVNEILKDAKRTTSGKLFKKDADAIDNICTTFTERYNREEPYKTLRVSFFETAFAGSFKWELSVTVYYQKAEQSGTSSCADFTWYNKDDYDRKLVVKKLPEIEEIERKIARYQEIENLIKDLDTERCVIEREYGISKFGRFVGK